MIDENLPVEIADDLRALGHDAMTVVDQGMAAWAPAVSRARGATVIRVVAGMRTYRSLVPAVQRG